MGEGLHGHAQLASGLSILMCTAYHMQMDRGCWWSWRGERERERAGGGGGGGVGGEGEGAGDLGVRASTKEDGVGSTQ